MSKTAKKWRMHFCQVQASSSSQTMGLSPQAFSPTHGLKMLHSNPRVMKEGIDENHPLVTDDETSF